MLQAHSSVYKGKNFDDGFVGYFSTEHLFVVLSIEEGVSAAEGSEILQTVKQSLIHSHVGTLAKFEAKISEMILQENLPAHISIAAGLLHNDVLYLKTVGDGHIYFRRGKQLQKIISGDNVASGYLKQFDCVIFTTSKITSLLGEIEDIKSFIDLNTPENIVEDLTAQQYDEDDKGFVALFTEFLSESYQVEEQLAADTSSEAIYDQSEERYQEPEEMEDEEYTPKQSLSFAPKQLFSQVGNLKDKFHMPTLPSSRFKKANKITMIGVAVIFAILVWSVVFGYQRRAEAQLQKKITTSKELISKKLTQAEDEAFLNLDLSMSLIAEAKAETEKLKSDVGPKKAKDIAEIEQMIKDKENQIVKKEEKPYDEFYDLALEDKDAKGSKVFLNGENVAILDTNKKTIYVLSLTKKSITKKTAGEVASASLIGMTKENVFFFTDDNGVYQFTSDDKVKQVIKYDDEWGEIVDLQLFGSNIYVLDKEKDEIFKYGVIASGYGPKSSYFQGGQSVDLASASSFAIDASVYVSIGDQIAKYTRGSREEFKTSFPTSAVQITKIYTSEEVEKVFAWDKSKGTIYVLNKTGTYERQLKSPILTKADDFFVYQSSVYILSGQKIYKMSL